MKSSKNTMTRGLWKKIYKLRKINVALTIYSLILTIILIVILATNVKAEEDLIKYNKLPVKVETLEHNIDNTTKKENSEVLQLILNKKSGKTETMTITAYCPCRKCCGKTDGITASNVKAVEGVTVAMDKSIPFGTKVYIDGVGERIVQDRGGAITGNRIDLYFDSHEKALEFGRQTKQVTIIK